MTRLNYLMERYRSNTCTRAELDELFDLLGREDGADVLPSLHGQWEEAGETPPAASPQWDKLFRTMMDQAQGLEPMERPGVTRRRSRRRKRLILAAFCMLFLFGGSVILMSRLSGPQAVTPRLASKSRRFKNDVQPGGNKAILILSDGSSVALKDAVYHAPHKVAAGPVYNIITTPRGGQYQIDLPDGSKVWLDAGSSLRFPTVFSGKEREVQLSGEAFFDVAGDVHHPFLVSVFSREPGKSEELQKIRVLGTQFNVMAYGDENMVKTTLVEGKVKIDHAALGGSMQSIPNLPTAHDSTNQAIQLRPGEQAQLTRDQVAGIQVVDDADVDAAVAWKNGYFNFNRTDIQTIMRQLSRWYDIDVSFRGDGSRSTTFFGGIQRNLPLSSIFNILERSGVQFSIDGRKVVVDL